MKSYDIEQPGQTRRAANLLAPGRGTGGAVGWGWARRPNALPFVENALAARCSAHASLPRWLMTRACAYAFGGLPGWTRTLLRNLATPKATFNNVRALLEQLQDHSDRRAAMVPPWWPCATARRTLYGGPRAGRNHPERRGEGGFGFDPVMFLPGWPTQLPLPTE